MESLRVSLPTGFAVGNKWYRNAWLKPLNGADEEAFREVSQDLLPVDLITNLLTRCLTRLGAKSVIESNDVASLVIGDRDALLLQLRRLTFGERIQSVVSCPDDNCKEKLDLELNIDDVLVHPNKKAKYYHEMMINNNGSTYKLQFSLPTGGDLGAVAKINNPDIASMKLIKRCINNIQENGVVMENIDNLPPDVVDSISKQMAQLDPQAEIMLDLTCPSCKHNFKVNFDIGDYFFKELMASSQRLYQEIHLLALHYHWSEQDILNMPGSKRQIYLRLLTETLNPEES